MPLPNAANASAVAIQPIGAAGSPVSGNWAGALADADGDAFRATDGVPDALGAADTRGDPLGATLGAADGDALPK